MTKFDRTLERLVDRMIRGCEIIAIAIGVWLMVAMIASVFFRYVLNSSLTWADESSSLLLVWLMLVVAPIGFHQNFHIAVSLVVERVPRPVRFFLGLFINSCTALLFGIAGYYGIDQTIIEMGTELASMPLSRAWFTWALPAGSVAVLLVCLNNIMKIFRLGDFSAEGENLE